MWEYVDKRVKFISYSIYELIQEYKIHMKGTKVYKVLWPLHI